MILLTWAIASPAHRDVEKMDSLVLPGCHGPVTPDLVAGRLGASTTQAW